MISLNYLIITGWLLLAGVTTFALTGLIRRYALAKSLLDIPNGRSSHVVPTPRGGGGAIVLTFSASLLLLAYLKLFDMSILIALFGAGVLVALVGFLDDHRHVAARWRLLVHFIAASWALIWLDGIHQIPMRDLIINIEWLGHLLAALYLVWLLNLYNFMDGIDGIAGVEAMTVCLGGVILVNISPEGGFEWIIPALLLVTVAGFLVWNFPKAKIFMGDAGSGFVGIVLGILSIHAGGMAPELFWGWVILLGAFVVDATITLARRVFRGEKYSQAHRSHAYQYAARKFNTHIKVTFTFAVINIIWLLPIAVLVVMNVVDGLLGVFISYTPLLFIAIYFKAGAKELHNY